MPDQLTARDLDALLRGPDDPPLLLDVREPWEFAICHLPDAHLLPMRRIPVAIAELDRTQPVVVICHHGFRSQQVALYLEHQGFQRVFNLQGGMAGWAADVDPSMRTY